MLSFFPTVCTLETGCHCCITPDLLKRSVKQPLGQRLGRAALDLHYNMSLAHTVPVVQACEVSGTSLTITFDPDRLTRGGASCILVSADRTLSIGEDFCQMPWPHCKSTIESEIASFASDGLVGQGTRLSCNRTTTLALGRQQWNCSLDQTAAGPSRRSYHSTRAPLWSNCQLEPALAMFLVFAVSAMMFTSGPQPSCCFAS